ncbi:hypothetical protein Taro_003532 [Colocasia esculenta]|uniref:Uncharacterized protein n=1 Tax=Colocasia esculenta TaxID=4460 RepID=A0A843TJL2_COLES|nr:hypothetical protein [Colocasia esculenta]
MSANREWMYRRIVDNEISREFRDDVDEFIEFALRNDLKLWVEALYVRGQDPSLIINLYLCVRLQCSRRLRLWLQLQMYNQITCRCPAFAFASTLAFICASRRPTFAFASSTTFASDSNCVFRMKFEPQDASYRFATKREVADARIAWDKIAANRFTDYLNKHKAAAKKTTGNFDDPLMWKGHGPPSIRRDYWDTMCDQWATEHFRHRSRIAAENRTKMPEATLHTSGSISFGRQKRKMEKEKGGPVSYKELFEHTHRRKNTGDFVSQKAKEETYVDQMVDKHGDDSTQHPEFDPTAWLAATGQPKKGRVFGFGSGLDAGGIINSSQDSHGSNTAVTLSHTLPTKFVRLFLMH